MTRTNTKTTYEHADEATTQVAGKTYTVWANFMSRRTEAMNEAGEVRTIAEGHYLTNDLAVRKALAIAYSLPTFRKN